MHPHLRVAGIPLRIDPTWLVAFALILWALAAGYFPRVLLDLSPADAWLQAAIAAGLLFVSVFLHELFHALVARQAGVRVRGIRLHVLGGVSELGSEPPTPRAEALIAVVGPLVSFVLAALAYGVGQLMRDSPLVVAHTGHLIAVNLLVGLLNLVPGLPLDGGRLLRAMLWWWSGRWAWATRWAHRAGLAFALGLAALGLVRAAIGDRVGGAWFVLLAVVLVRAARTTGRPRLSAARAPRDVAEGAA